MELSLSLGSKGELGKAVTRMGRTEGLTKRDTLKKVVTCIGGEQLA